MLPIKPYFISRSQIYHIRTVLSTLPRDPIPATLYPCIPPLPDPLFLFHYWAVYPKLRNCHSSSRFPRVTNKTKLVGGESRRDERGRRCKGSMFELGGARRNMRTQWDGGVWRCQGIDFMIPLYVFSICFKSCFENGLTSCLA